MDRLPATPSDKPIDEVFSDMHAGLKDIKSNLQLIRERQAEMCDKLDRWTEEMR